MDADMRFSRLAALVVAAVSSMAVAAPLLAQDPDIVARRQAEMKAMGKEMGAIKKLVTGSPEDLAQVKEHAAKISTIAGEIPTLFPDGSDQGKSEALPVVWTQHDDFVAHANKLKTLADQLSTTAESGDAKQTTAAFAAVGKEGCGACHQTYRKPQT
jgi:cytochrome c556